MSYILDALKKQHEQNREIGHVPTVDTMQSTSVTGYSQKTVALWAIIFLLLAIVALLSGYVWSQLDAKVTASADARRSPTKQLQEVEQKPLRPVRTFVPPALEPVVKPRPVVKKPTVSATVPAVQAQTGMQDKPPSAMTDVPLLEELTTTELQGLPPISLDVHVYAEQPERRFVLLNLKKLREGDKLDDILVEAITPEGVILSDNGIRFRLQRQ